MWVEILKNLQHVTWPGAVVIVVLILAVAWVVVGVARAVASIF